MAATLVGGNTLLCGWNDEIVSHTAGIKKRR